MCECEKRGRVRCYPHASKTVCEEWTFHTLDEAIDHYCSRVRSGDAASYACIELAAVCPGMNKRIFGGDAYAPTVTYEGATEHLLASYTSEFAVDRATYTAAAQQVGQSFMWATEGSIYGRRAAVTWSRDPQGPCGDCMPRMVQFASADAAYDCWRAMNAHKEVEGLTLLKLVICANLSNVRLLQRNDKRQPAYFSIELASQCEAMLHEHRIIDTRPHTERGPLDRRPVPAAVAAHATPVIVQ